MELHRTFIFVDGLDEAEYAEDVSDFGHYDRDVQDFVRFLLAMAAGSPDTVRLWCSSQNLPTIRNYLEENNAGDIQELPVHVKEVQEDIIRYLSSAMPATHGDSGLPQAFVRATLETEVEGSFLWAKHMLHEIKSSADDDDDMLSLVQKGLPSKMSDLYEKILERVEKRGNGRQLPLWKIVLSLVTFAKRPLRVVEAIEAVAIARSEQQSNLNDRKIVSRDRVVGSCLSLVHSIGAEDGSDSEALRLSHSSVRKFLLSFPWHGREAVSNYIIRMCCLRYLTQPRYSQPLKVQPLGVYTAEGDNIRTHRLLVYAAKYWHQHCDSPRGGVGALGTDERDIVISILKSSNLLTIMQVQSFFVVGHFLQNFDPITDQEKTIRRTMPDWIMREERHLDQEYRLFQSEWCHLLQSKIYARFNGELERCFWQSLGPGNFLSHNKSRYRSFPLGLFEDRDDGIGERSCRMIHCSFDGKRFMTCYFQKRDGGLQQLQLQHWALANSDLPQLAEQSTITVSSERSCLDLYPVPWMNTFRSMPLIPHYRSFASPEPVFQSASGSMIRIGTLMFQRSSNTPLETIFSPFENKSIKDSWDGVVSRGPFSVFYRRSKPRPAGKSSDREKVIRRMQARNEHIMSLQALSRSSSRDDSSADGDSGSADESASRGILDCPSADESFGDDHSGGGECSSDEILSDDPGEEDEEDISLESYPPSSCPSDLESPASSTTNSDVSDSDSIKSDASIDSSLGSFGSDAVSIESSISENSSLGFGPLSPDAETYNQVYIGGPGEIRECDWCTESPLRIWYRCIICEEAEFDLCESCEWRGMWCLDIKHQLYKLVKGRPAGVISWRSFDIQQEIAVLHSSEPASKIVFHLRKRYRDVIYESLPVIHPDHALMVWPLSGSRLLFADIKENKYFEYPLRKIGVKKAHPICIELSFSSCGSLLRLAAIDATSPKPLAQKDGSKSNLCLKMHILLLRLSPSSPTRTAPTLHASRTVSLPCSSMKPVVTTLPFAFTWTPEELYVTMSSTSLCVYRIEFPKVQAADPTGTANKRLRVQTPVETILLPRSSRTRSVQFFPALPPDPDATVIIGPRYGKHPSPAIGVYLTQSDLGGWQDVCEGLNSRSDCVPEHRLAGQFEDFDEDEDCDIIPFDD